MVLSLTNIAASKIPVNIKLDPRSEVVLKNIHSDLETQLIKLNEEKNNIKSEYYTLSMIYYSKLLNEEYTELILECSDEMSARYNEIIELRNQIAHLKLWSPDYVKLDLAVSRYIAWTSTIAEKQELLTLFYGVFSHHKNIELDNPNDMELSLLDFVNEYVERAKFWYNTFNTDIDEEYMINLSIKMKSFADEIMKLNSKSREIREIYEKLNAIFYSNENDEIWAELVTLIPIIDNYGHV